MARSIKKKTVAKPAPVKRTAAEMQQWYEQNKDRIANFEAASDAYKELRDVTKTSTKTISTYDKDSVITYLQNIGSNEKNLRGLSRYLYYRSHIYFRLVDFYSNMFELSAREVIPTYTISKSVNTNSMLKQYEETLNELEIMDYPNKFKPIYTVCFREDVFYGVYWLDDTGMTIINIDPDYGKIDGVYETGDFSWAMDMSWFRSRQDILEFWGEPFTSMYREYESSRVKWQHVDEKYAICLKFRSDDWETVIPPFCAMFLSMINLEDLSDIQAVADEQQIYKLLYIPMVTRSNANGVDDWKISPDLVVKYWQKLINDLLPDYTDAAIVPAEELGVVDFSNDAASDTNKVQSSMETILNTAGGAEVLNGSGITTTAAFEAALIAETQFALSSLLPQTEGWVNRVLSLYLSDPCKVKQFEVSCYTKKSYKDELLAAAQNGMPTKIAYNTLNGFSERDTLALNALETALGLPEILKPLQTSYTQSGDSTDVQKTGETGATGQGAPTKDSGDLTDSGDASRNE